MILGLGRNLYSGGVIKIPLLSESVADTHGITETHGFVIADILLFTEAGGFVIADPLLFTAAVFF